MEELLDLLLESLRGTSNIILYLVLFVSSVIENLFPPIPGDVITAFGAFLVGTGRLSYLYVFIATSLGSVIGFMMLFLLGKHYGHYFLDKDYKYFSASDINKSRQWILTHGNRLVLANRFLPGVRSVISFVAGISRLNTAYVFISALASAMVWNIIWIQTGFMLGDNWEIVREKIISIIRSYNIIAGIVLALIIAFIIFRRWRVKKRDQGK